jgi:hypothetical protein
MGIETALLIGSTVMQAEQQSAAGKFNQAVQNRNAEIAKQEANQIEQQNVWDLQNINKKFNQLQGQVTTRIMKSGTTLEGSGLRVLRNNAEEVEQEKKIMEYNSKVASGQRNEASNMYRIQGQFSRSAGDAAALGTLFKGASSFAGSAYGKSLLANVSNPFANRDLTSTEGSF